MSALETKLTPNGVLSWGTGLDVTMYLKKSILQSWPIPFDRGLSMNEATEVASAKVMARLVDNSPRPLPVVRNRILLQLHYPIVGVYVVQRSKDRLTATRQKPNYRNEDNRRSVAWYRPSPLS